MDSDMKKTLNAPDETREFGHGKVDLFHVGGGTVGRFELQPGWRWSNDVKPLAGTGWCQQPHFGYQVSGVLHVAMSDGSEYELEPETIGVIPPGHDAWVVGNEPVVSIDWSGAATYAQKG